MEWNAAKQALACPYCGFVPKEQPSSAAEAAGITEHDLEKALAGTGDESRGYGAETVKVNARAATRFRYSSLRASRKRCDFCGSPSIVPYQETRDAITPESLLPVKLDASRVRDIVKGWVQSRWFAPDALKSGALTDTLKAIYLPYWTFDASAHATGPRCPATTTTRPRATPTPRATAARQVRHVRWYPSAGSSITSSTTTSCRELSASAWTC